MSRGAVSKPKRGPICERSLRPVVLLCSTLRPGSSSQSEPPFRLKLIPAQNFRLPNLIEEPFLSRAELQLHLETAPVQRTNLDMQGLALIRVSVGTLTSAWIHFPVECRKG